MIKDEKIKAGEHYEPEARTWPVHVAAPFSVVEKKFIICIDTLGQDRGLTDEQKKFALNTATRFKNTWEKFEHEKLIADRNLRMKISLEDKEFAAEQADKQKEDEDKYVADALAEMEDIEDEDEKSMA